MGRRISGIPAPVTFRHQGKPLILKSPPHTARMAALARMFPNARFLGGYEI